MSTRGLDVCDPYIELAIRRGELLREVRDSRAALREVIETQRAALIKALQRREVAGAAIYKFDCELAPDVLAKLKEKREGRAPE